MVESLQNQVCSLSLIIFSVDLENGEYIKLLPFGIQHDTKTKCIVGNGVIIDPGLLLRDMDALSNNGIDYSFKLKISDRCHFVTEIQRKIC
jgi:adenylosuccinate synthase